MPATLTKTQDPPTAETEIKPAARDVPAGTSWVFRDHWTMKEVLADERTARRRAATARKPRGTAAAR
jgi:hypothetical protein